MQDLIVHIVSFDIPWPANYGGVIDVFHKIRVLHNAGVRIRLHCFEYGRKPAAELGRFCESVYYYPRKRSIPAYFGRRPYIVSSRMSEALIGNLLKDDYPVILEGLHTCGLLGDPRLAGRFLLYRESNIEHHYYYHLFRAEKNLARKAYFLIESLRLKRFQRNLSHASVMLAVSQDDTRYLKQQFPEKRVICLPSFHPHDAVKSLPGKGTFVLYHGKLSVPENSAAAQYLISRVWDDTLPELVIAGLDPPGWLSELASRRPNIRLVPEPSDEMLAGLIREAHINLLITFQPTGLKLKLLNALFNGRFCLVNPGMVAGTPLGKLCEIADSPHEIREKVRSLFAGDFNGSAIGGRAELLEREYSNQLNCKILIDILTLR